MLEYRMIKEEELSLELFENFRRHQDVTKCWRKEEGSWRVKDIAFVDDWKREDYEELIGILKRSILGGGMVYGAFEGRDLKGFCAVSGELFGSKKQYLDLSNIYVSEELRGQGVGSVLFRKAQEWAGRHGAEKLYISAHSAVESQAFYKKMGCVEAQEYSRAHVEKEPCDCQLECPVPDA